MGSSLATASKETVQSLPQCSENSRVAGISSGCRPTGKRSERSSWRLLGHESGSAAVLAARHESGDRQAPQRHQPRTRVHAEAQLRAERRPRPETPRRGASRDWRIGGARRRAGRDSLSLRTGITSVVPWLVVSVSGHADPNQRPFLTAAPPARAAASSPAHGGDKTALAAWIPKSRVYGPCHRARHVCIGRGRRRRRARTLVRVVRSGTEISAGPFLRSSWPSVSPTSGPGHPHGMWGHHKPTPDAEQDAAGFRAEPRTHMLGGSTSSCRNRGRPPLAWPHLSDCGARDSSVGVDVVAASHQREHADNDGRRGCSVTERGVRRCERGVVSARPKRARHRDSLTSARAEQPGARGPSSPRADSVPAGSGGCSREKGGCRLTTLPEDHRRVGEPSLRDRTSVPPVGPEGGLDQQASRDHATTFDRIPRLGDGPISAGGDAAVDSGDRKLYPQAGPGTEGAVEEDSTAEGFDAVLDAEQPGASREVSATDAVVADCNA